MNSLSQEEFEAELKTCARALSRQGISALEGLYDLVSARLLRYTRFLTRTPDEAEDVLQASMLALARHPRKLHRARHPWAYLLKLTRNQAYSMLVRKKTVATTETIPLMPDPVAVPWDGWERSESVQQALLELPSVQAEVVTLKLWEGLTFREIAQITEEPLNTVTSRYRYAMEKLAALLKPFDESREPVSRAVPAQAVTSRNNE